ncbi:MAG: hypothetical protein H7X97_08275 [Opitutaceae bacterium]|nr:hypothetical protein [Verrucomicrobiales bacterium]
MKKLTALRVAMAGFAATSFAADVLILNETFPYPNGSIVGAAGSEWINNSGTAGQADVSGGELRLQSNESEDVAFLLSGSPFATNGPLTALYSSFRVKFIGMPSGVGAYFAHFIGSSSLGLHRARIWVSTSNTVADVPAPAGKFRLGIGNTTGASNDTGQFDQDLDTNVYHTVVTRYVVATGVSTLWVNPMAETDTGVTATDASAITNMAYYGFRQAAGIGTNVVDDLRIGNSFFAVTTSDPSVLNPPTISAIPAQTTGAGVVLGPINFTVADGETLAADLTLGKSSTNLTLVPDANIVFGGSGGSRTVTITPALGQQGETEITITVTDGNNNSAARKFLVRVGYPSITAIPNVTTASNTTSIDLTFTVGDGESLPGDLQLSATSSYAALIPDNNVIFGGSGASRTVRVTPAQGFTGNSTITVTVSDGQLTATTTFIATVSPELGLILNETFTYPDGSLADGINWLSHSGTTGNPLVISGRGFLAATNAVDVNRELLARPFGITNGHVFYASYKLDYQVLPSGNGGDYFSHFKDTGTANFRARSFALTNGAAAGKFRMGVANSAASVSGTNILVRDLATNTTHTVVVRYNPGTGECRLWVNPASEADVSAVSTDSSGGIDVDSFALRQNSGIGALFLDDLKVGGSFATVYTAPVPSPTIGLSLVSASTLQIAWTTNSAGYVLQSKGVIDTNVTWLAATETGSIVGTNNVVTVTIGETNRFFRLFKAP